MIQQKTRHYVLLVPAFIAAVLAALFLFGDLSSVNARAKSCDSQHIDCIANCNTYPTGPPRSPAANHRYWCFTRCEGSYRACQGSASTGGSSAHHPVYPGTIHKPPVATPPTLAALSNLRERVNPSSDISRLRLPEPTKVRPAVELRLSIRGPTESTSSKVIDALSPHDSYCD